MSTHVTCGHCNGTGVCKRGTRFPGEQSCATCLESERKSQYSRAIVKCSVCKGTGFVKLSD